MSERWCSARVLPPGSLSTHNCSRKGIIERGSKWYCRQHDPFAVAERHAKQKEKSDEKWTRYDGPIPAHELESTLIEARQSRRNTEQDFCAGVSWQDGVSLRDVIIELASATGTLKAVTHSEHPRAKAARALLAKFTVEE